MLRRGSVAKPRKPGRRPNSENRNARRQDAIIAVAVHQLLIWDFALRREAAPAVSRAARSILGRTVGKDRVEQIYEAWRDRPGGVGLHGDHAPRRLRSGWRKALRPTDKSLDELASYLLKDAPEEHDRLLGRVQAAFRAGRQADGSVFVPGQKKRGS